MKCSRRFTERSNILTIWKGKASHIPFIKKFFKWNCFFHSAVGFKEGYMVAFEFKFQYEFFRINIEETFLKFFWMVMLQPSSMNLKQYLNSLLYLLECNTPIWALTTIFHQSGLWLPFLKMGSSFIMTKYRH